MQSPPFPHYLVPPRSKYSPQYHVLKHPHLPFLLQCQQPMSVTISKSLDSPHNSWLVLILHDSCSIIGPYILPNIFLSHVVSLFISTSDMCHELSSYMCQWCKAEKMLKIKYMFRALSSFNLYMNYAHLQFGPYTLTTTDNGNKD